jgi:aspartate kinase
MINVYPDSKVFIIDDSQLGRLEKLLSSRNIRFEVKRNCAKVTVIGNKMRGVPGVMAKVIRALSKHNIELLQTSDSHTTISCLIDSEYTNEAVNALHEEFELGKIAEK